MALNVGDAGCTTGLSKRIFDAMTAQGLVPPANPPGYPTAAHDATVVQVKKFAFALSTAFVAEIVANGEAYIGTSLGALQQENDHTNTMVDTHPPTAERSIPLR